MPGRRLRSEAGGERCLEGPGAGVLGRLGRWQVRRGWEAGRWRRPRCCGRPWCSGEQRSGQKAFQARLTGWARIGGVLVEAGQGRGAHPGHSRPFSPLCILRVRLGLREPEKTPSLWGDFLELVPPRKPQEHRGHRGPHPRSQGRCAETDGSGTAPVSMTVPWKQTAARPPAGNGRAFPGQTQGGGALRPGTAEPILGAGDHGTSRPRRAGRGLPLKQAPPLPGFRDGRTAHLVSSPHSFHWRLPREGPRLLPSAAPTPPEDRNFPSDTLSPPRGPQLSSLGATSQPGASA